VLKGGGVETYEPRFTYHGFRYVELTGCPQPPTPDAVTGVVLHADMPPTGTFECSNPLVNQLQHNIVWGQKGNFLAVPTDCPQRAERLGWMGDAQAFIRTACFNMDVAAFFTKWADDVEDGQNDDGAYTDVAPSMWSGKGVTGWADAGVLCPWAIYLCFDDTRILDRHYDSMARWVEFMRRTSTDLIRPDFGYGDWLSPDGSNPGNAPTPKDLIGTAYFACCAELMSNAARLLGKTEDAERFAALAEDVKTAFNREFVTATGRLVGHTQTGYVLALAFDLLPEAKRPIALRHLVADIEKREWHLTTGFIGCIMLPATLTRFGRTDVAYKLLTQESYPSWLYPVKHGATTIWERWDGWTKERGFQDPGMNSFNHYAYGAVGQWMYATVAGIDLDPDEPAYKHVLIRPEPGGGLTHARAELLTMYGPVVSAWKLDGDTFTLDVTVPANTRATVTLPTSDPGKVTENGKSLNQAEGVSNVRIENGKVCCETGAGRYSFVVKP
jgi:alpha-L-rhamnosidase